MRKKFLGLCVCLFAMLGAIGCSNESSKVGNVGESSSVESVSADDPTSSSQGSSPADDSSSAGPVVEEHEHEWNEGAQTSDPTCEDKGVYTYTCIVEGCKEFYEDEIDELGHDYGAWTETRAPGCVEEGEEQRVCKRDGSHTETRSVASIGHKFGEWKTSKPATCEEKGEEERVCSHDATHVESRATDALKHNYGEWSVFKAATCEDEGESRCVCSNNTAHYQTETIDPLGHAYGAWSVSKDPTVTEEGEERRLCARDASHVDTRPIAKLEHDYGEWSVTKTPTCEEDGEEARICKDDPTHVEKRKIDKLGHQYGQWTVYKSATCAEGGEERRVCARDASHVETRGTEKTNVHTPDANGYCGVCETQVKFRPTVTALPTMSAVYYGEQVSFSGGEVKYNGAVVKGTWSSGAIEASASGTERTIVCEGIRITFVPMDDLYLPTTAVVSVTVYAVASYEGTYYTTLNGALTAANAAKKGTVYALSGDYATEQRASMGKLLTVDTIAEGVTLALPYADTNVYTATDSVPERLAFDAAETYLKNNVTVGENVTLYNYGTIKIGGVISGGSAKKPYSSFTALEYAQLTLADGAKIVNYTKGTSEEAGIQCYGRIVEATAGCSGGIVNDGGSIVAPFTVRDHRGGTVYAAISGLSYTDLIGGVLGGISVEPDITPFNRFFMPNVTPLLKVENGGTVYGFADLYANDAHQITFVNLVGWDSSFLIQLYSGSYLTSDYDDKTEVTALDIYGKAAMNSMSMTMNITYEGITAKVSISTKNALFPINWHYNVSLHAYGSDPTVTFNQSIKILPGGSLTVDKGVTVTVGTLAVYETFDEVGAEQAGANAPYEQKYPSTSSLTGAIPGGKLTVNGTLNVKKLGGFVQTSGTGAALNITEDILVNSKELSGVTGSGIDATASYRVIPLTATVRYFTATGVTAAKAAKVSSYLSKDGGWYYKALALTFDFNGGEGTAATSTTVTATDGYTFTESNLPTLTRAHYSFDGWYIGERAALGVTVYESTHLVAKWTALDYTVAYDFNNYYEDFANGATDNHEKNPTSFTVETNTALYVPVHPDGYVFDGWYLDPDYTEGIARINGAELLASHTDGKVTLYGRWYPVGTETYKLSFVNTNADVDTPDPMEVLSVKAESVTLPMLNEKDADRSYAKYFDGWFTDEACTLPFSGSALTGDTVLYAKWSAKTAVSVELDASVQTYYYKPNDAYTLPATPAKEGYGFMGWRVNGGELYTSGTSVTVGNTAIKVTAVFAAEYTLSVTLSNASVTVTTYFEGTQIGQKTVSATQSTAMTLYAGSTFTVKCSYSQSSNKSCTVNGVSHTDDSTQYTVTGDVAINASSSSSGCIAEGTLVTLYDGTQKKVEELTYDDVLLVFNHETGKTEAGKIVFLDHLQEEAQFAEVVTLTFSNGATLRIVWNHGLFDRTLNEYAFLNAENACGYIGHTFYTTDGDVILIKAETTYEWVRVYNPTTALHMNYFASGILNVTAAPECVSGHVNYFALDENMRYDQAAMQADIERYGLYAYEDFSEYLTREEFVALPFAQLKVAVGKGMITFEDIVTIINYLKNI